MNIAKSPSVAVRHFHQVDLDRKLLSPAVFDVVNLHGMVNAERALVDLAFAVEEVTDMGEREARSFPTRLVSAVRIKAEADHVPRGRSWRSSGRSTSPPPSAQAAASQPTSGAGARVGASSVAGDIPSRTRPTRETQYEGEGDGVCA